MATKTSYTALYDMATEMSYKTLYHMAKKTYYTALNHMGTKTCSMYTIMWPYNHAPVDSVTLCETTSVRVIRCDGDLLRATAVTRGCNGCRNKSQHIKLTQEKKILPPPLWGLEPATFRSRVLRATAEISPIPIVLFLRSPVSMYWYFASCFLSVSLSVCLYHRPDITALVDWA